MRGMPFVLISSAMTLNPMQQKEQERITAAQLAALQKKIEILEVEIKKFEQEVFDQSKAKRLKYRKSY